MTDDRKIVTGRKRVGTRVKVAGVEIISKFGEISVKFFFEFVQIKINQINSKFAPIF